MGENSGVAAFAGVSVGVEEETSLYGNHTNEQEDAS